MGCTRLDETAAVVAEMHSCVQIVHGTSTVVDPRLAPTARREEDTSSLSLPPLEARTRNRTTEVQRRVNNLMPHVEPIPADQNFTFCQSTQ